LGRLQPDYFPHIFGKEQNEPLSYETSLNLFKKLTEEINQFQKFSMLKEMSIEEVALGFIKVANEHEENKEEVRKYFNDLYDETPGSPDYGDEMTEDYTEATPRFRIIKK
jgi:N-methylhydantoinase A/oxoprolinase/acetone carboxylase beta subunit